MNQRTLFDLGVNQYGGLIASSRRTDPVTSREAAERHERSGRASSHREVVLECVRCYPGSTGHEIAALTGLDQVEVVRRLGDLQRAGVVRKERTDRRCRERPQSRQSVWFLV